MGIGSIVPKVIGYAKNPKVVNYGKRIANYGKRIVNVMPEAILGNGAEVAGKAMRATKGSLLKRGKAGFKALEADIAAKKLSQGGFLKRITSNLGDIPKLAKEGFNAAKAAGKNSIWGGVKGLFKGLGKNMPFIGAATTLLFELPNIWTATKEQGIGQGVAEVAKAGTRLAGGAAGAAIGSAIFPGIGTIVGWIAGEWLTGKIVGKTYSEKKAEAEALAQEAAAQQETYQPAFTGIDPYNNNPYGYNPYGYNPYNMNDMYGFNSYANPYSDDIMMQQMNFNTLA